MKLDLDKQNRDGESHHQPTSNDKLFLWGVVVSFAGLAEYATSVAYYLPSGLPSAIGGAAVTGVGVGMMLVAEGRDQKLESE